MIYLKAYKEVEHYKIIEKWAIQANSVAPPSCVFPIGVIAYDDNDMPVGCGFIYIDSITPVSVIEWIFFEQKAKPILKKKAMESIMDFLESVAQEEDHNFIMAGTAFSGIEKQFIKNGYTKALTGATHLFKVKEKI